MFFRAHLWSVYSIIVAAALFGVASPAFALQPLAEFLAGARHTSVDNREAAFGVAEQDAQALAALGRELPDVTLRGTYTRNQFAAVFPLELPDGSTRTLTIQPFNQWDLFVQIGAPLIDAGGWSRASAARRAAKGASHHARATELETQKQVARYYYLLIGADALRTSAEHTLTAAEDNAKLTRDRRESGIATALDVERAEAEVERARQSIADADLQTSLAARALQTLTGVTPSGETPALLDDLHAEAPLDTWEATPTAGLPALAAATAYAESAALTSRAAKLALVPTLNASFTEHISNATGFIGRRDSFTFALNAVWRLDVATIANVRAQAASAAVASIREERTRLATRDQIHEAWQRVRTGVMKSRAARAQSRAAALAAEHATVRYASGTGTQLDLVQAQRDAFSAEVGRISADADLALSRAVLRLAAGVSLDQEQSR